ncbi:blue light receptor [Maudiozyma exigua]|uniref:Blue light receptor n=1 Tax=Maudiozyma exigua TaxID=34358 RepID=A0A9P6W020_MAUEX|nr:blue light receptor [Kazachstania exigua]
MELDKDNTMIINGYIIKNLVCQTNTFKLCDAIDSNGNSFVLKIIPADIKVNLLKEEHIIESFVHNDELFINITTNGMKDINVKSILNNNNLINAGVNKSTNVKFCSSNNHNNNNNNSNSNINNTNVNNINMLSIDLKNGNYLEKKIGFNNKRIIRTPIPKNCNTNFDFPGTPESNISLTEDSESESDSECDSEESFDDDEDENMSNEDSDIEHEVITPVNKKLDEMNNTHHNLIPILKVHDSADLSENHIKNVTPETSPNYVHQPSHIHIQCPLMKLIHPKHTEIRKTPIPREMLRLNQNHTTNPFNNSSLQNEISDAILSTDSSNNSDNYNMTTTNKHCNEPFKLQMVKSSMLRRRSSTKCQSST